MIITSKHNRYLNQSRKRIIISIITYFIISICHVNGFCVAISSVCNVSTELFMTHHYNDIIHDNKHKTGSTSGTICNSSSSNNRRNKKVSMYIISFPSMYPLSSPQHQTTTTNNSEQNDKSPISPSLRLLKTWKYYTLGDGGVYFDQRPKILQKLNQLILHEIIIQTRKLPLNNDINTQPIPTDTSHVNHIKSVECAVISTCKRFEILITIESSKSYHHQQEDILKNIIVSFLTKHILSQKNWLRLQSWIPLYLLAPLDRPSRLQSKKLEMIESVCTRTTTNTSSGNKNRRSIDRRRESRILNQYHSLNQNLLNEIELLSGHYDVANRLILLASGLLDRPKFRPFSSRDSHIMSQLKQTLQASQRYSTLILSNNDTKELMQQEQSQLQQEQQSVINTTCVQSSTKYSKILFDSALQGGKAARSSKVVPILDQLRDESYGADGPIDISAKAAIDAKLLAVNPTLTACLEKLKALEASEVIAALYDGARKIANRRGIDIDSDEGKFIRKMLHKPVTDLRKGNEVNVREVLKKINTKITSL